MKVRNTSYQTNPYVGVTPASPAEPVQRPGAAAAAEPAAPRPIHDQATVMGIPEAELTPKVREAIGELMAEVQRLRSELDQAKRRVDHLEHLADRDTLTPLLNRRAFVRELSRIMSYSERYQASNAVLYFDVDGLKQINDTYGHSAGDAALAHVAGVLVRHVRASDVVGRLGGDEFGVILVQADLKEAHEKAQQLAAAIRSEPALWQGKTFQIEASYGVHSLSAGQEAQDAIDAADRAMYAQKRGLLDPAAGE